MYQIANILHGNIMYKLSNTVNSAPFFKQNHGTLIVNVFSDLLNKSVTIFNLPFKVVVH